MCVYINIYLLYIADICVYIYIYLLYTHIYLPSGLEQNIFLTRSRKISCPQSEKFVSMSKILFKAGSTFFPRRKTLGTFSIPAEPDPGNPIATGGGGRTGMHSAGQRTVSGQKKGRWGWGSRGEVGADHCNCVAHSVCVTVTLLVCTCAKKKAPMRANMCCAGCFLRGASPDECVCSPCSVCPCVWGTPPPQQSPCHI